MEYRTFILLTSLAILIMYAKWIFMVFLYITQVPYCQYRKHRNSVVLKMLSIPGWFCERMLNGGDSLS